MFTYYVCAPFAFELEPFALFWPVAVIRNDLCHLGQSSEEPLCHLHLSPLAGQP